MEIKLIGKSFKIMAFDLEANKDIDLSLAFGNYLEVERAAKKAQREVFLACMEIECCSAEVRLEFTRLRKTNEFSDSKEDAMVYYGIAPLDEKKAVLDEIRVLQLHMSHAHRFIRGLLEEFAGNVSKWGVSVTYE